MKEIQKSNRDQASSIILFNQLPMGTIFAGNADYTLNELFTYKKISETHYQGTSHMCTMVRSIEKHWVLFFGIMWAHAYSKCEATIPLSRKKFTGNRLMKLTSNLSKRNPK